MAVPHYSERMRRGRSAVPRSGRSWIRFGLAVAAALAPRTLRRLIGTRLLGWDMHETAEVGRSIVDAERVVLGPGAIIRSMNIVKGLEELSLAENASIGMLNWISGPPLSSGSFPAVPNRYPALILGVQAAIVNRHLIDCSDTIRLHDRAMISGMQSLILTHSVDLEAFEQRTQPIEVGESAIVMARSVLLPGASVPRRSVISAGSVVSGGLTDELTMYRGTPAAAVRQLPATWKLFSPDRPRHA